MPSPFLSRRSRGILSGGAGLGGYKPKVLTKARQQNVAFCDEKRRLSTFVDTFRRETEQRAELGGTTTPPNE